MNKEAMSKKKILISVNCLKDIGGISTAAVNLLNEIHSLYEITLVIPSNFISDSIEIPLDVIIIRGSNYLRDVIIDRRFLAWQSPIQSLLRNARRLISHYIVGVNGIQCALSKIKVPGEFDVAIAFADFKYSALEMKSFDYDVVLNNVKAKRKIAWIHNDAVKMGWTRELVLRELSKFDSIVNVSKSCKEVFDNLVPELHDKSKVVYNTYNIRKILDSSRTDEQLFPYNGKIHFVTVARMQIAQKRIDRIIEVVKKLKDEGFSNFDWLLVGSGDDLKSFMKKVVEYNITDTVYFAGLQANPYPYFKQADAYVLSSEYEGFGMTIRESQIIGTPTLVTKVGPAEEAVLDGKQGEICANSTSGVYNMIRGILLAPDKLIQYSNYIKDNPVNNAEALAQFNELCN